MFLATRASRPFPKRILVSSRAYSSHGHEHEHKEHEHGQEEHHEEHGHDEVPLSESESIINKHTGIFAGICLSIASYAYINSSYKKSHDGESLTSIIKSPRVIEELQANYDSYRERVKKQTEIQEMMMFPGERKTVGNLVTRIDTLPGRHFNSGSGAQFNTIQDWEALAPRKVKESPFY